MSPERAQRLKAFVAQYLGADVALAPASNDASFRSYLRAGSSPPRIVMNAPPECEDVRPWLDVCARLSEAGVGVPEVIAADTHAGFVLMSDLGSRHYLDVLAPDNVDALYGRAMDAILAMQTKASTVGLPEYDEARLGQELALFPEWFLARHLHAAPDASASARWQQLCQKLIKAANEQPQRFVHRDFHSRNLLLTAEGTLGIIDFQDAVRGPLTYDLVSLLRDCYVRWTSAQVASWCESFRVRAQAAGLVNVGPTRFRRWFDWMGLQRHLKVLGIFARLHYRDGKSAYLADMPLVLNYVLEICARYGDLAPFGEWLEHTTRGVDLRVSRA